MDMSKPYEIPKKDVMTAFKRVKANGGSAGIDEQDIKAFEEKYKDNLYKIWNRMSSGSYFPPPVKQVEIPKKAGGTRKLGIPTVGDRVAQMVAKMYMEAELEPIFHEDSYGYRPGKSAIDAIGQARTRCWRYDYVIEFDIKGLFDNIDHELLMKAVRKHVKEAWVLLYIERWLKVPFVDTEGDTEERKSGTPQGGVISPLLANLFMHYAFDMWMVRKNPQAPFERYADDAIIHCETEAAAEKILGQLKRRMKECKLELHPEKTKIVYCKDNDRRKNHQNTEFDFLGYTYRKRFIKDRLGRLQLNFLPAVSKKSAKAFREKIKAMQIQSYAGQKIEMIAEKMNPVIRGWLNYFMKYCHSLVKTTMDCLNLRLVRWAMHKYKKLRGRRIRARKWLVELAQREPKMFVHWAIGYYPY